MSTIWKGLTETFTMLTGWVPQGFTMSEIPSLEGKVAIVTGASAGLGLVSTLEMAKKGAHVYVVHPCLILFLQGFLATCWQILGLDAFHRILACRSQSKTEEAITKMRTENPGADLKLTFMECDLASLASVRKFSEAFAAKKLPIHILMNNAGM